MAKRRGKGKGKGKGWKNLIVSDSYRHELSRRGIKTNQVSLSKSKRKQVNEALLPLLAKHTISGYNIVENPHIKKKDKYQVVYGHDVIRRHRTEIIQKFKDMKLDYYVLPREAKFLSEESFIKTPNQIKIDDIISNDKEYQIVVDVNDDELIKLMEWMKRKTVNWEEIIQIFDWQTNPATPIWAVTPLKKSYTVPDIRIRDKAKYEDFKRADKIVKKLDEDTDLVILSVRPKNTKELRKALKNERKYKILIQNYYPEKHSLYKFIKDNTKEKR